LELLQLKYFKSLAHNEHLTKTAKEMYVTPSTISSSLSRLEKELQVSLFNRVGRNIRLNDNGRIFLTYVDQILESLHNAKNELSSNYLIEKNTISLGLLSPIIWNNPLFEFQEQNPHIKIRQATCDIRLNNDPTLLNKFDHFITAPNAIVSNDWNSIKLFDDYLVIAVQNTHPFAKRSSVDLRETSKESFIGSTSQNSFQIGCKELFISLGIKPNYVVGFDYTIRPAMLRLGYGIILTNKYASLALSNLYGDDIAFIRVENKANFLGKCLYWRKSCDDVEISLRFRSFMKDYDWGL